MENQFSQKVSDILLYSQEEADRLKSDYVGPEHILLGLIRDGESNAIDLLNRLQVSLYVIKSEIEISLNNNYVLESSETGKLNLNEEASKIMKISLLEARKLKKEVADSEHLLLAILHVGHTIASDILEENHINYNKVMEMLTIKPDIQSGSFSEEEDEEDEDFAPQSGTNKPQEPAQSVKQKKGANETPVIDNFSIDMTRAAEEGKLDPVVGRDKEIERIAQILSRRKKNNPVLIGEPGVGKSAIVEGLALRIVQKKVSRILFNKRVVSLDMASVVAGTKYRGQFEERIRSILKELQKNPDIILFIDEIHTIVGAGSAPGSMDAANMLKPALARGEIQCIGATTLEEYRKNIEKDGALDRRFQKVIVDATSAEETLQILKNIKDRYEDHHNVTYTDGALEACVKLADRYITDRNFPDKAIDILDESGSRVHIININVPKEIEIQEKQIEEIRELKNAAVKGQNFELAAEYRDKERIAESEWEKMKQNWENGLKESRQTVDEGQIADVVSMTTGIPVQRIAQAEGIRLKGMKTALNERVIAQEPAIEKLVKAIQRNRVGLKDPNKPIGTFMFLGPTGVGKTLLAKELAKYMFGSADALIRVDMSEYMEKFNVSRLVGAPPGYVGYEEGGQLTEKVRRRPYSIILLDEIEKAHSDVFNLLLQVTDEGRLTDSYGRIIDFRNTVIIMTSNIGSRQLKDFGQGIGFSAQNRLDDKEFTRSIIQKALNKTFSPEFINRIDEIITFDSLSKPAIMKIVDIEVNNLLNRIRTLNYEVKISEEAKHFIGEKGFDTQYGARPLKRAIQTYLEDELAERLVEDPLNKDEYYCIELNHEKKQISFHKCLKKEIQ